MDTEKGLNIEKKGTVKAERISDGGERELVWGKIDDSDAGDYQDTLGIKDGTWIENGEDKDGTFFVYEIGGERYKIYQDDLNSQ